MSELKNHTKVGRVSVQTEIDFPSEFFEDISENLKVFNVIYQGDIAHPIGWIKKTLNVD